MVSFCMRGLKLSAKRQMVLPKVRRNKKKAQRKATIEQPSASDKLHVLYAHNSSRRPFSHVQQQHSKRVD
jgi:hypothetical protein